MKRQILVLLLLGGLVFSVAPCLATPITFAEFVGITPSSWVVTAGATSNTVTVTNALVAFFDNLGGTMHMEGVGYLNMTASTSTKAIETLVAPFEFNQGGWSGSFSIYSGAGLTGTDWLTGSFSSSGAMHGGLLGNSGGLDDSDPPAAEVNFSSGLAGLLLSGNTTDALAFTWSGGSPGLALVGGGSGTPPSGYFRAFNATPSGTFSQSGIPEAGTLLLLGLGLLSLGLLRRRVKV